MAIQHVIGDATDPQTPGPKVITHCCNDMGRWGAGFTGALSRRWPDLQHYYREWYSSRLEPDLEVHEETGRCGLGEAQLVRVEEDIWVANIIGQHGIATGAGGRAPIRYDALRKGLVAASRWARIREATVHMPKMGSGLAGGHWGNVESLVKAEMDDKGLNITVYRLR